MVSGKSAEASMWVWHREGRPQSDNQLSFVVFQKHLKKHCMQEGYVLVHVRVWGGGDKAKASLSMCF